MRYFFATLGAYTIPSGTGSGLITTHSSPALARRACSISSRHVYPLLIMFFKHLVLDRIMFADPFDKHGRVFFFLIHIMGEEFF